MQLWLWAIMAVGNYGEIYERHMESIVPRAAVNEINIGVTGRLFALPFGDIEVNGAVSKTLGSIRNRGILRCGVNIAPGFAKLDQGLWTGMDVDYCRAVSAAIFSGSISVVFTNIPSAERFKALANGFVDIVAGLVTLNMERDVNESSTGKGHAFSEPMFYDGLTFSGLPE